MSFLTPQAELDLADAERLKKVRYYVGDPVKNRPGHLYAFLTDVLDYDALTEAFHKPLLDAWDRIDLRRMRLWLGLPIEDEPIDDVDLWFRGGIKTWCKRGQVIRYYVWDPQTTVTWWHAVEEKAVESGEAIGDQLLNNKKLRALFPSGVLPAMNRKKFCAAGRFRLRGQKVGDAPSFSAMGAGGESTGAHSRVCVLDDFVGYNDVVDAQMAKKKQFYQATVRNVCLRTAEKRGWVTAIGTHWAIDDPYVEWRDSPDWVSTVRACMETDGKPDPGGEPVYLSREQIEKEKREQGSTMFAFQMMNDPSPSGSKPWNPGSCEKYCTLEEAKGPGWILALGDPAPFAVGSVGGRDEMMRKDGTKNWWANVILKLRRHGDLRQMIWLDAQQSREWGLQDGMQNLVKMGMRWRAHEGYAETTSTPVYREAFIKAKADLGSRMYIIGSRGDPKDRLEQTYNKNAKCNYLIDLCGRAKVNEFVICESVPKGLVEVFLQQIRGFMPLPDGRTGIPFDDLINALAFATDPYFGKRYQRVEEDFAWSPYRKAVDDEPTHGSRYVRW